MVQECSDTKDIPGKLERTGNAKDSIPPGDFHHPQEEGRLLPARRLKSHHTHLLCEAGLLQHTPPLISGAFSKGKL